MSLMASEWSLPGLLLAAPPMTMPEWLRGLAVIEAEGLASFLLRSLHRDLVLPDE